MALLFMDSFDHYATADFNAKWTSNGLSGSATVVVGSANGRHSSNGLRLTGQSGFDNRLMYVQKTLAPADATCTVGVAFRTTAAVAGTLGLPILSVRDGVTAQVTLRLNPDSTLSVLRGIQNGTVLGTTSATFSTGGFSYLELKVLIHPSAGTVDLRLNGASVLSLTAQNTRGSANSSWNSLLLGNFDVISGTTNTGTANIDYDDLYVLDGTGSAPWNTFLGDCRVDACYPTGAGATTGWTPSSGSNWQNVDDAAPNGDTDYNTATTAPLTDTFIVQDAPVVGATIYGMQHCLTVKKMDAGSASIAPVVRHSGTDNVGSNLNPGTAYGMVLAVNATNPGTSAQWTESGFNAAEFGYKKTA